MTSRGTFPDWHTGARTGTNLYQARLTVQAVDGRWRISALELLEEKRQQ